jgi:hypothetical protein
MVLPHRLAVRVIHTADQMGLERPIIYDSPKAKRQLLVRYKKMTVEQRKSTAGVIAERSIQYWKKEAESFGGFMPFFPGTNESHDILGLLLQNEDDTEVRQALSSLRRQVFAALNVDEDELVVAFRRSDSEIPGHSPLRRAIDRSIE